MVKLDFNSKKSNKEKISEVENNNKNVIVGKLTASIIKNKKSPSPIASNNFLRKTIFVYKNSSSAIAHIIAVFKLILIRKTSIKVCW
jgi:hypothetical protein